MKMCISDDDSNILDEAEAFDREFASRARRNLMGGTSGVQSRQAIEGDKTYGGSTSGGRSRHVSDHTIFPLNLKLLGLGMRLPRKRSEGYPQSTLRG